MACKHPLQGFRSKAIGPSGRRAIVFSVRESNGQCLTIPCGQCAGCRLERSRQWAMRCMHEASEYDRNCFVTLTLDDAHLYRRYVTWHAERDLYYSGSLNKRAFPLFMKRLRQEFSDDRPRYYHCGEYGGQFGRPHYHALLFNFDFADKRPWGVRNNLPVFRSEVLERLWPYGQSEIGSVTFESAAYVARYIMKKVTGGAAAEHYRVTCLETGEVIDRVPEFTTMSRRPGIGRRWFDKFGREVYERDEVPLRGRMVRPPRSYDVLMEQLDPVRMAAVKAERKVKSGPLGVSRDALLPRVVEYVDARVRASGVILDAEISLQQRGLE